MTIGFARLIVKSVIIDNGSAGDPMTFAILLAHMHWRGKEIVEWRDKIGPREVVRGHLTAAGWGRDTFARVKSITET